MYRLLLNFFSEYCKITQDSLDLNLKLNNTDLNKINDVVLNHLWP